MCNWHFAKEILQCKLCNKFGYIFLAKINLLINSDSSNSDSSDSDSSNICDSSNSDSSSRDSSNSDIY